MNSSCALYKRTNFDFAKLKIHERLRRNAVTHTHTHVHKYIHTYIRAKNYSPWMELEMVLGIARGPLVTRDKQLSTRGPWPVTGALNLAVSLALIYKRYISLDLVERWRESQCVTYLWLEIRLADSFHCDYRY